MRHILFPLFMLFLIVSCHKKQPVAFDDQVSLAGCDTLVFSLDDSTYYNSKAIFQYEDNEKEYLSFQNDKDRGKPRILIFDIENQNVFKTVPLYEEGPNAISVIFGGWPVDMNHFIVTTYSTYFYLVDDMGNILKKIQLWDWDGKDVKTLYKDYCLSTFSSYYSTPAILQDSILYFKQSGVGYPRRPEEYLYVCLRQFEQLQNG